MITPVGLVLFATMLLFLVFWRRHFVWFLAAMIPFPQTAMFVVAGQGVSPFYAAAIVATALGVGSVVNRLVRDRLEFVPLRIGETALLAAFAAYSTAITLLGPLLFEGIGVFSPRLGIGSQLANQTPLTFTVSNLAQLAYLLLGVGVVVYVLSLEHLDVRLVEAGIWVGLLFTLVNAVVLAAGLSFPRELFDTLPTIYYQGGSRLRGPFAEPSVLGAFLSASLAYLVNRSLSVRGPARAVACLGIAIAVYEFTESVSGTALVALSVVAGVALAAGLRKWAVAGLRRVDTVVQALLLVVLAILLFPKPIEAVTSSLVADKVVSDSYADRTDADGYALTLLRDSWGLGVGLGSNRPSSFGAMLLSCVGVVGTLLLVVLVVRSAFRTYRSKPEYRPTAWALMAVFVAMMVAKADLATPMLWMALAMCIRCCRQVAEERQKPCSAASEPEAETTEVALVARA